MHLVFYIKQQPSFAQQGLWGIANAIANSNSSHTVTVVAPDAKIIPPSKNISICHIKPIPKNVVQRKIYLDITFPSIIKKLSADVLVSDESLVLKNIKTKKFHYSISKYNEPLKSDAPHKTFSIFSVDGCHLLPACLSSDVQPLSFVERMEMGSQYSHGFLFHLHQHSLPNAINLLKAFTIFKKWQKSSLQLFVLCSDGLGLKDIANFNNYLHKGDVHFVDGEDFASAINCCFAAIDLGNDEHPLHFALHALKAHRPLIALKGTATNPLTGAAILCPNDVEGIATCMQFVYKNEADVKTLVPKGAEMAQFCTPENAAATMLQLL